MLKKINFLLPKLSQGNNSSSENVPVITTFSSRLLWGLFFGSVVLLFCYMSFMTTIHLYPLFRINGFTILIWVTVLFFSAIIGTYAKNYLRGFQYQKNFTLFSLGFAFSVMLFIISNHVCLLLITWFGMSYCMANLIGINKDWGEAKQARKYCFRFFLSGGLLLCLGVFLLYYHTKALTLDKMIKNMDLVPSFSLLLSSIFIITAALIQSAIYPFHRWLLSAMTAPTPASALMHAGFVNASGILLTLFSVVLLRSDTLTFIFIIGGLTAVIAQFTKLLQVNVKQKLACSTIAQMGFMIMQCGLGYFNAAIVHLILHGFYKAYLFLSSGEEIERSEPAESGTLMIKPLQLCIVIAHGVLGALLFALITDKSSFSDSSIFLTLIVAITVGQVTYNILKFSVYTFLQRLLISTLLFLSGIIVYSLVYNVVTAIMIDMPMIEVPQPISALQIFFGIVFLLGFFFMKLEYYKDIPWLYVKLLNLSQPTSSTSFQYKSSTNDRE